jgi:hypothetical protein
LITGTGTLQVTTLAPPPLVGDYNADGAISAADYDTWRGSFGQAIASGLGADGDGSGQVDAADFVVWRKQMTASGSGGGTPATVVPEPTTLTLFRYLIFVGVVCRHNVRRH